MNTTKHEIVKSRHLHLLKKADIRRFPASEGIFTGLRLVADFKPDMVLSSRRDALLNQAARIAKLGFFEINRNNGEIKWSRQLLEIFEIEKGFQIITGCDCCKYIHPDDLDTVVQAYADALKGSHKPVIYRIQTGSGKTKFLKTIFAGLPEDEKDILFLVPHRISAILKKGKLK
jgi:hypothetical protein